MWSHRRHPIRLYHPWDSPGKNTGMGCYFLLQCMKVKSESEVAQSCPTLSDPTDCSLPGSSAHGIFQARVLEWAAIAFSRVSSLFSIKWGSECQGVKGSFSSMPPHPNFLWLTKVHVEENIYILSVQFDEFMNSKIWNFCTHPWNYCPDQDMDPVPTHSCPRRLSSPWARSALIFYD